MTYTPIIRIPCPSCGSRDCGLYLWFCRWRRNILRGGWKMLSPLLQRLLWMIAGALAYAICEGVK